MNKDSIKTKDRYRMPDKLWKILRKQLHKVSKEKKPEHRRAEDCNVVDGIWHVLCTGCQWKSIQKEWFGVSSSVSDERFQTWQSQGLFEQLFHRMLKHYARECGIRWKWQSIDSMMSASPLGGAKTGKNPTDRGKSGSKIHLLVDQRGAPLAIWVMGSIEHDKWSVENLVIHIAAKRLESQQHLCEDKGYDFDDVHEFVGQQGYVEHIKHRRRQAKNAFPPAVGSWSELSAGWLNAEALPPAGVKSLKTGSLSSLWIVPTSSSA